MISITDCIHKMGETYIIAEIGQNHQGDMNIAKRLIDEAASCGVQAVKTVKRHIPTFRAHNAELWAQPYENPNSFGSTYGAHRQALELSEDQILELQDHARRCNLEFFCSFTDIPSLEFLVSIGVPYLKVPSQRATDVRLLQAVNATRKPVILSTGMCDLKDVGRSVSLLANCPELYLMQCTSAYPCQERHLNLHVIKTLEALVGVHSVGFSGHHIGIAPDVAAVTLGARIIERHFTLSRAMKGTDHAASLEPAGLEKLVRYIRQAEEAMGSARKEVLDCEMPALKKLRADLGS